jgi:transcriptional regulator with XRE-family HTH domain
MTDDQYRTGIGPQQRPSGFDLDDPALRQAAADRDIAGLFRLRPAGMTQRRLAELVGMSQSEVADILAGRKVKNYDVFVRIAAGLVIPRGMMGLGSGEHVEAPPEPGPAQWAYEESERVKRRKLLELGMTMIVPGAPAVAGPRPVPYQRLAAPSRVGLVDVEIYEATVTRLTMLDSRVGGAASRSLLSSIAESGEAMLGAEAIPEVANRLCQAVAEAHRAAAWAAGDVALMDVMRWHAHRALDLVAGDRDRVAQVMCTVGSAEKGYGEIVAATDLFQVAQMAAALTKDPQVSAVIASELATGYHVLGYPEKARGELDRSYELFAAGSPAGSLPCFASYGNGHGALAAAEQQLGSFDLARAAGLRALAGRPDGVSRSKALDTVILATTSVRAGELNHGVAETREALRLVQMVGSRRVRERMKPLAAALGSRNDSTCRDLARMVARAAV